MSASPVPPGAPPRIWLNLCDEADCGEPFESHHGGEMGVTWTEDTPALLHAVEYARADLLSASESEVRRLQARLALVPPKLCGRCEATLHPERRERTLCRRCQTDAIREGVSRAWRNRRRAALAPTGEPGTSGGDTDA